MKNLLKLEEAAQLLLCLAVLAIVNVDWWVYLLVLVGPDISMLGYLMGTRTGAFTYNLFHHKAVALVVVVAGFGVLFGENLWSDTATEDLDLLIIGIVLYGHSSMDRMVGYGLKFGDSFQHTHLGWIGKLTSKGQEP